MFRLSETSQSAITAKFMMCQYVYCKWEKIWNKTLLPIRHPNEEFTTRHWAKLQRAWTSIGDALAGNQTKNFHKNTVHKPSSAILLINLQQLQFIQPRYVNYDVTRRHFQDKSRINTKLQRASNKIGDALAGNQTTNFHKNTIHKPSTAILLINLQQLQFIQPRYVNYDVTRRHCQDKSRINTKLQRASTNVGDALAGNQTKNFHKNTVHKPSSAILLINLQQLRFIQPRYINYDVTRRHCQDKSRITTAEYYENK